MEIYLAGKSQRVFSLCSFSPPRVSFPCSVQKSEEAADFPLNLSPSCRSKCQSNSSAATGEERRGEEGRGGAAAEAPLFWWNVGQEKNWVTCTVITRRLLMFSSWPGRVVVGWGGGGGLGEWLRPEPPPHAANGSCPWWWMFLHRSRVKPEAGPLQEGAPL